jgi:thymidine phosphorylase
MKIPKNLLPNKNQEAPSIPSPIPPLSSLTLKVKKMNMDTRNHFIAFIRGDCALCRSAGLRSETRVHIRGKDRSIIATLDIFNTPLLKLGEIGLSDSAWKKLSAQENEDMLVTLAEPLESFSVVRAKLYGKRFTKSGLKQVMTDMLAGRYSDIQKACFITAAIDLNKKETVALTKSMSESGEILKWDAYPVVDKHCIGGVPGNRTTMIVVPIIASFGLTIPKTSSRAITSPSGTADTMEVLAPVNLNIHKMRAVVEKEGGCIIWGGALDLSPVDDILVQIEKSLDLDTQNQLVASVLSKKVAAGSTHVLIDMPVGTTAKVRSQNDANKLSRLFFQIGKEVGLQIQVIQTDGSQPIGRGIGPVLEARDVLSVLHNEQTAPRDLKEKAIHIAGKLLEFCGGLPQGKGVMEAKRILDEGLALKKFISICEAQGGMRQPTLSKIKHVITAVRKGRVIKIHNRLLSRIAKLAGAPASPSAGIDLHVFLGESVEMIQPLFTIYAETLGELNYALNYFYAHQDVIIIGEEDEPASV